MDKEGVCVLVSSIFVSKLCPRFDQVKNIMDLGVLCKKFSKEKYLWIKGLCVLLFVLLAIPCFIATSCLCK